MPKNLRLVALIAPAAVFVAVFLILVLRLPRSQPNSIVSPEASPPPQSVTPHPSPTPMSKTADLTAQMASFQVFDPQLAAPNFDRSISLAEKK